MKKNFDISEGDITTSCDINLDERDKEVIGSFLTEKKKKISDEFWMLRRKDDKQSQKRSWALGDELEYLKCLINRQNFLSHLPRILDMLSEVELASMSGEEREIVLASNQLDIIDWQIMQKEKELSDLKRQKEEMLKNISINPVNPVTKKDMQIESLREKILSTISPVSLLKNQDELPYFKEFVLNYVDDLKTRDFQSSNCRISRIPSAILLDTDKQANGHYREIKDYLKSIAKGDRKYPEGLIEMTEKLQGTKICRDLYQVILFRAGLLENSIGDTNGGKLYWNRIDCHQPDWKQIEKEVEKIEQTYNLKWPYEYKVSDIEITGMGTGNWPQEKDLELQI